MVLISGVFVSRGNLEKCSLGELEDDEEDEDEDASESEESRW